jgi:hypothetical protein
MCCLTGFEGGMCVIIIGKGGRMWKVVTEPKTTRYHHSLWSLCKTYFCCTLAGYCCYSQVISSWLSSIFIFLNYLNINVDIYVAIISIHTNFHLCTICMFGEKRNLMSHDNSHAFNYSLRSEISVGNFILAYYKICTIFLTVILIRGSSIYKVLCLAHRSIAQYVCIMLKDPKRCSLQKE